MVTFKKTKLAAAIVAAGSALLAGQAQAVFVNDGGLGQALIYPYYTVRGDNVTLLSVVNTTGQAKVVKVRFREGKNTSDVLDFNLFLSAYDVWTGGVFNAPDNGNGTGGAILVTKDTSCTSPTADEAGNTFRTGIPFRTFDFPAPSSLAGAGATTVSPLNDNGAGSTVDRVREGYIEIIEIGTIENDNDLGKDVTHDKGSATVARTPSCKIAADLTRDQANDEGYLSSPSGGLFGNVTYVNAPLGGATSVDATALDAFWPANFPAQYTLAADDLPNLGSASPTSVVVNGPNVYISTWNNTGIGGGFKATTAVLMRDAIYNEYAYTNDRVYSTDWVVTMPSKRYFVNQQTTGSGGSLAYNPALPPFQSPYRAATGSCDTLMITSYDREEGSSKTTSGFSPVRPGAAPNQLCWEANVIGFGKTTNAAEPSRVLGSTNNLWFAGYQNNGADVPTVGAAPQGEGGWAKLRFTPPTALGSSTHLLVNNGANANTVFDGVSSVTTPFSVTYSGLPVVGFATTIANQGARASYGTSVNHRYSRVITTGIGP